MRFGPGLRPGPRRQARWVPLGSGAQGRVPKILSAKRLERIFGVPLTLEGPTWTMRGVPAPVAVIFRTAIGVLGASVTAWTCSRGASSGRDGGDRLRPVPGQQCAAARRAVGLPPEGRGEAAAQQRRAPRRPLPLITGPRPPSSPRLLASAREARSWPSGPARRRCALETVEKAHYIRWMVARPILHGHLVEPGNGRRNGRRNVSAATGARQG